MQLLIDKHLTEFERHGYVVIDDYASPPVVQELAIQAAHLSSNHPGKAGIRSGLQKSLAFGAFAKTELQAVAGFFLGAPSYPVKLTIFDKNPDANWMVPMHQDLSIAVKAQVDVEGFHPWSVKEGIPHVIAPEPVLRSMIAIRLHLDDATCENGALRVVPGSHRRGKIASSELRKLRRAAGERGVAVRSGGLLVMSPLLVHASSPSSEPLRRRVLHYEFTCRDLPGGLEWAVT